MLATGGLFFYWIFIVYRKLEFTKVLLIFSIALAKVTSSFAQDTNDDSLRRLERLLGAKISKSSAELQPIINLLRDGKQDEAFRQATQLESFYRITVKNFATRMSVRSQDVSAPLNDFSATIIGITRDNRDAKLMLTGNFIYWLQTENLPAGITVRNNMLNDLIRTNNHYMDVETNIFSISLKDRLLPTTQMVQRANSVTQADLVQNPDPAGLLTSNTWAREHFVAGTNRRPVEYSFISFLCTPMEEAADTQANDSRIGRDIDRFPGNDHTRFLISCKGCHTVMDGFRGAFAMWNFDDFMVHGSLHQGRRGMNAQGIANKMNQNAEVYPSGFQVTNTSWVNYATRGKNVEHFGWPQNQSSGTGVASFAKLLAESERFPLCMAKRAFNEICRRAESPLKNVSNPITKDLAQQFVKSGYNLRELFIAAAKHPECLIKN